MQCISPIRIRKNLSKEIYPDGLVVGCGKCVGCQIAKRREWSLRLLHEMNYHDSSMFLTLTYSQSHLPTTGSLQKRDLQLFFKLLRKRLHALRIAKGIKYFACGEYGETGLRPHYHMILFGLNHLNVLHQEIIKSCWAKAEDGCYCFAQVEQGSIEYVVSYMDKVDKTNSLDYIKVEVQDKQLLLADIQVEAPFHLMSKGLGLRYLERKAEQIKKDKYLRYGKLKLSIPRYYKKKLMDYYGFDNQALIDRAIEKSQKFVKRYTNLDDLSIEDIYSHPHLYLSELGRVVYGKMTEQRQYALQKLQAKARLKKQRKF